MCITPDVLTALRFHGLTTQAPADVWIALPEKARKPRLDYPRLRVARFSGPALHEGIETHRLEKVEVRVYSAAKTVADCFKYRNKVGIDVAVEALRDFTRRHRGGANALARYARLCRVTQVMQPYLDAGTREIERATPQVREPRMLADYEFSKGIRGKYARRVMAESKVVVLAPDLARRFKDSRAVNRALRSLGESKGRLTRHRPELALDR